MLLLLPLPRLVGSVIFCRSSGVLLTMPTIVYCDNVIDVYLSANPVQHRRTKHIELDMHFVREKVALGALRVLHVPSCSQFADIFTKGLPSALFHEFRSSLHVGEASSSDCGGVLGRHPPVWLTKIS